MKNEKNNNVYVYGTLMFDSVLNRIINGNPKKIIANAKGFKRLKVKNEDYPGLIRCKDIGSESFVNGVLLLDVSEEDIARLDSFEADCYLRESIDVHDEGGNLLTAYAYIVRQEFEHTLSDEEWDAEEFNSNGIERFSTNYDRFPDVK